MRIQKNIIRISITLFIVSLCILAKSDSGVLQQVLISILASAIVLFFSSVITYQAEKKRCVKSFSRELRTFRDQLNMLLLSEDIDSMKYNFSIIQKWQMYVDRINGAYLEISLLMSNRLKKYILESILEKIDSVFQNFTTHYGMLRWILLYQEDEDLVCAHYLHCLNLGSRRSEISNPEINKSKSFKTIEEYISMSNPERIAYHNNEIISCIIYPYKLDLLKTQASKTILCALPFLTEELTLLIFLSDKIYISKKYIDDARIKNNSLAFKWDEISKEAHEDCLKKINKIKENL